MGKRQKNFDLELFSIHAEMCKVFSHPKRLELLHILRDRESSVGNLAERLGLSIGNLSQHLAMMKQRGVLLSRKEGNVVYYRLGNPKLLKAFDLIRAALAEQIEHRQSLLKKAKG